MNTELLIANADDLAEKAVKTGCAATKFLSPAEAEAIKQRFARRRDVNVEAQGGYAGAERVRFVFLNPDWGQYEPDEVISAIKIEHRPQDIIGHRDILGALMNLGIKRETIGDIAVNSDTATFVCLPELAGYISENLTKVGRVGVNTAQVSIEELYVKTEELKIKTITVSSLRTDAVISAAFNISRSEAAEFILRGMVSVGHIECQKPDKEIDENVIFSVRGLGRAKITEIGGKTRKGRISLQVGIY